jgi:hypothetical protein
MAFVDGAMTIMETKHSWRVIGEQFNQLVESVVQNGKRA